MAKKEAPVEEMAEETAEAPAEETAEKDSKRPPADERETSVSFTDADSKATVTTYDADIIKVLKDAGLEPSREEPDGFTEFDAVPKGLIAIGHKLRKARAPRNLTREQKDEKLRQLRVGKMTKRLVSEGKSAAEARQTAERTYGTVGKPTAASKPGGDPFAAENAPGGKKSVEKSVKKPAEKPAQKAAEKPASKGRVKNAGL